jgi:hypothetical protein
MLDFFTLLAPRSVGSFCRPRLMGYSTFTQMTEVCTKAIKRKALVM